MGPCRHRRRCSADLLVRSKPSSDSNRRSPPDHRGQASVSSMFSRLYRRTVGCDERRRRNRPGVVRCARSENAPKEVIRDASCAVAHASRRRPLFPRRLVRVDRSGPGSSLRPDTDASDFLGQVPTSEAELGFALGSQEVTASEADEYVQAVDAASPRVVSGASAPPGRAGTSATRSSASPSM